MAGGVEVHKLPDDVEIRVPLTKPRAVAERHGRDSTFRAVGDRTPMTTAKFIDHSLAMISKAVPAFRLVGDEATHGEDWDMVQPGFGCWCWCLGYVGQGAD